MRQDLEIFPKFNPIYKMVTPAASCQIITSLLPARDSAFVPTEPWICSCLVAATEDISSPPWSEILNVSLKLCCYFYVFDVFSINWILELISLLTTLEDHDTLGLVQIVELFVVCYLNLINKLIFNISNIYSIGIK